MIDIHNHMLPGLDDGAANLHEAMEMAKQAVEVGIHTVVATPHHGNALYDNPADYVGQAVESLRLELKQRNIPLQVLPGQEVRVQERVLTDCLNGIVKGLNHSRYVLLELPYSKIPKHLPDLLHELSVLQLTAIIAHPERNHEIAADPNRLAALIELGALSQLTAHSILGGAGRRLQQLSFQLCRQQLVHFVASDAHHATRRPFLLPEAYRFMERKLGAGAVEELRGNARRLIELQPIEAKEPLKRKRLYFWRHDK